MICTSYADFRTRFSNGNIDPNTLTSRDMAGYPTWPIGNVGLMPKPFVSTHDDSSPYVVRIRVNDGGGNGPYTWWLSHPSFAAGATPLIFVAQDDTYGDTNLVVSFTNAGNVLYGAALSEPTTTVATLNLLFKDCAIYLKRSDLYVSWTPILPKVTLPSELS